jgi:tRNA nucleotidyltransferase (CCA-adding enzyme)
MPDVPRTVGYTAESDAIVDLLMSHGFDAYYVGGCVRDKLLGIHSKDIDIATNATLDQIKQVFPHARVVGEAFSVALVNRVEVATFRIDGPYSDYRHPDYVTLVGTIEEDLGRRDFTINAMAEKADGTLVDPYGGRQDLADKIIRFVGDAHQRLTEDPIRSVRACRFIARIKGCIDDAARNAILQHHELLAHVARERIQMELNKILMLDDRETALFLLSDLQLLHHILPRLAESIDVPQNKYHAEDCWVHAVKSTQAVIKKNLDLRLAVLVHDIAKPATRIRGEDGTDHFYSHEIEGFELAEDELRDLHYSRNTIEYVKEAIRFHMSRLMFCPEMKDTTIRRLMGKLRHMPVRDLLRLQIADMKGNLREPYSPGEMLANLKYALNRIRKIEAEEHALKISDLDISGDEVMKILGVKEGPEVGNALRYCFEKVMHNPELNTKESLVKLIKEYNNSR